MSKGDDITFDDGLFAYERFREFLIANNVPDSSIFMAGSLRREKPIVHDLDLVICHCNHDDYLVINGLLIDMWGYLKTNNDAKTTGSFEYVDSEEINREINVNVYLTQPPFLGACWLHATGSVGFNKECRYLALKKGWRLNQYGLFKEEFELVCDCSEEETILKKIGFESWVTPEARSK